MNTANWTNMADPATAIGDILTFTDSVTSAPATVLSCNSRAGRIRQLKGEGKLTQKILGPKQSETAQ
jgi:hypothetical protein